MSKKRRRFTAEFKARVALDALSGEHTLSELAAKYGVHPNQISQWKKQAKEGVVASFSGKAQTDQQSSDAQIKELHAKIGQLTVENDGMAPFLFTGYTEGPSPLFRRPSHEQDQRYWYRFGQKFLPAPRR